MTALARELLGRAGINCRAIEPLAHPEGEQVERVVVTGSAVLGAWEVLRDAVPQTNCWPLITGKFTDPDAWTLPPPGAQTQLRAEIVAAADAIDISAWLAERLSAVDEVALYDRALSREEVWQNYLFGKPK